MKCHYPEESPYCAFHYNGICSREHNYECPALVKPTDDVVEFVRCQDCKWWDKKKRVCEHPEWTDMDGWHKATDAEGYCFRAEQEEKTDE